MATPAPATATATATATGTSTGTGTGDAITVTRHWASVATLALALLAGASLLTGFTWADAWSPQDKAVLASMSIDALPAPPRDASNAVEDKPAAADLGQRLFNETRFSRNQAVACASCHAPQRQFQDGLALAQGLGTGTRRTMPIAGVAHNPWFFWDGRKDSLWSQALGPLEDAVEHGSNRTRIAKVLQAHYRADYEALFGPFPDLSGLPDDAGPQGSEAERAAWGQMPRQRQQQVNRVFANLGKAIAAYERTLSPGESRFDRYVRAVIARDREAQRVLTTSEVSGLRLFIGKAQCVTCHNGPLLTDQHFHNTGVPPRDRARPDHGRAPATARVQRDEFNCLGAYSDAAPGAAPSTAPGGAADACAELRFMASDDAALEGAFKTPSLRNVEQRAPYMHAGQFGSLEEAVAHYARSPAAAVGHSELAQRGADAGHHIAIRLTEAEVRDVAAFLRTLSGPVVARPAP